ncbi:serine/threonine protein kinase [Nonomuraea sp. H19]|uniref:serine/threonine protein kinase n=1 Tax=Nonomuraea sp. H19 TaxID=3452206 RepID=UPI003F8B5604
MPSFTPLRPGDPLKIGGLELLGKLGEGGQGVVYLAKNSTGAYVAVKWLRADQAGDQVSVRHFLREAETAQRVARFCTAAVLATGVEQDRPYIVSEFVEGPSLEQVVRQQGPRTGSALDRLAIGTATALAAIHQAGIVHRDFKPGNVILGADGPRVIDFGIARRLNATAMTSSTPIGTPAYMSPEQIMGHAVGPAADMFSWAGTIVFASCGRAPFGSDGVHAVMSRVLRQPPDPGPLDGPLREVVLKCLDKDPRQRPTAQQAIERLLRHPARDSSILVQGTEAASPEVDPPRPRDNRPIIIGAAVTAVLLVLAGVAVTVALRNLPTVAAPVSSTTAAPQTTAPVTPTANRLPGGSITLYEHPSDPITLTAYEVYDKKADDEIDYARQSLWGPFSKHAGNWESLVSPDGRHLAGRPRKYTSDGYDSVLITDRQAGSSFRVKTVRDPLISPVDAWSKDGSKVLLNIERKINHKEGEEDWIHLGFAIIDVAQAKVNVINLTDVSIRESKFGWDANEEGAVAVYGKDEGLRFFDASGKATRDIPDVGPLSSGAVGIFSPSGKMFVTDCPGGGPGDHCIWDTGTAKQIRKFTSDCEKVLGWYDEAHLYCWELDNAANDEVQVVGFSGKLVRRLLEVPDELDMIPYFTINPSRGSS